MVTSGVVLRRFGSQVRSWSFLPLFGLAQFTSGGCVKEVDLGPEASQESSPSTQEKGPGPGPEDTSAPSSGTTTPDSMTTSGSESPETSTSTEATSSESVGTPGVTEGDDTGDPNLACDQGGDDRQCVPKAPPGWLGPVGLLQASEAADVRVCKAYSDELAELFDEVSAPDAKCEGCVPRLEYPESIKAQAVEYGDASCSEKSERRRSPMGDAFCRKLEPDGDGQGSFWRILAPEPKGALSCTGGAAQVIMPKKSTKNFFRGCQVERKGTCEADDEVCTKKGVGPTCVYRLGDMKCPSAYSARKRVLFGGVEDTRGCSACEGVMKKQGSWTPKGKVSFYDLGSCYKSGLKRSIELSKLGKRCDSETGRVEKDWKYARMELTQPDFKGVCETKGWKPEGGVKGLDPVTICCRGVDRAD